MPRLERGAGVGVRQRVDEVEGERGIPHRSWPIRYHCFMVYGILVLRCYLPRPLMVQKTLDNIGNLYESAWEMWQNTWS
jgi:hypothetical protein